MSGTNVTNRVVVTGMGIVAPNGQSVQQFWSSLTNARSGLSTLENIGPENFRHLITTTLGGQIKSFDHRARIAHLQRDKILPYSERYSWLAAAAAHEAVTQSGLTFPNQRPERVAVVIGSATGGQATIETASCDHLLKQMKATHPLVLIRMIASSAAAHLGIEYGAKGPVLGISSGCASADHAIALGRDYVKHGAADIAIVGGTEAAMSLIVVLAMESMGLLTNDACRPFAANRSGTVLSEGSGILILESEEHAKNRGAKILAELAGSGMTGCATDDLAPNPGASAKAMTEAIADAGLQRDCVTYLNASGIGTRLGDENEALAIKLAFGEHASRLSVSSTKPVHGYAIGATGAFEAIACIKAIETGIVPPTAGLEVADPALDLDFTPRTSRHRDIRYAMTTSLALEGTNTALLFGKYAA